MVRVCKDNVSIYFLLEKAGMLFTDFSVDHIISFDHEEVFFVVIYSTMHKNFVCFEGAGYLHNAAVLPDLIQLAQEYEDAIVLSKRDQVVKLIEHEMHSNNNSRLFFDAH